MLNSLSKFPISITCSQLQSASPTDKSSIRIDEHGHTKTMSSGPHGLGGGHRTAHRLKLVEVHMDSARDVNVVTRESYDDSTQGAYYAPRLGFGSDSGYSLAPCDSAHSSE
ncbi:unnamed protein product [Sphenostylis stenocarpa]|uniref:Uncharacterized protein n=1 Tax=Sphenostylis stenocarpa TaxID=92480 RepID=A0AA86STX4_9FABA|nr:unnamed protein product [Sphenostylis stenocarpa]